MVLWRVFKKISQLFDLQKFSRAERDTCMFSVVPSSLLQTSSASSRSSSSPRRSSAARLEKSSVTCFAAVRRVAVQQQQQSEFVPGSLLSRVVNLNKNTINWEALEKALESLSGSDGGGNGENGEDASGVFGLVRGELNVKTREELTERSFGYKEFVLLRTLGLKTYTLASCFRAKNVKTPVLKCAVGRVLADPGSKADGFYGLYARCSDALSGSGGEDDGGSALKFLDRVTERIETIAEEKLDEEFVSKTKNRYAKDVDESTFERAYGENAKKAVEFVFSSENDELILDVPNFDLPENIGSALAGGEVGASTAEDDDEPFAFGKKSKKKKKKAPAAASAISDAMKSASGGQKSTLEALADLITTQAKKKKQQEPTFPEFANWGQSTAAEAMGILLTICLAIGEECVGNKNSRVILVLPSDLMLSALFFDRDPCVLGNQNENFCICASESAAKALLEEENTACDTTTLARIRIEGATPSVSDEDLAALLRRERKATRAKTLALRLK
jgi:ribosomal protein S11